MRSDSAAVHAGREDLAGLGVHAPPLDLSSTNPLPDVTAGGLSYEEMAAGGHPLPEGGHVYGRLWNPTVARFEAALARLEGAAESVAFASGMAAMTAVLLAAARRSGHRHVVAVRPLYGGTDHLLATGLLGTEATFCAPGEVADALRPDTALVVVETPANPTLDLVDLDRLSAAAGGVPLLVDNTFATPILQNPLRHGAALVLHSATKYLGGHGDAIGGAVACGPEWAAALRRVRAVTGGLLHPLGGYLLHRGLATLPVRVRTQQDGARRLASWLAGHPRIARVHYPAGHPLVGPDAQMRGPGAMLAVEVRGGFGPAAAIASAVRLFTHAVSLGGVESLVQHPASLTHRPVEAGARPSPGLLRLSVGLEDPRDLVDDLDRALTAPAGGAAPAPAASRPATRAAPTGV